MMWSEGVSADFSGADADRLFDRRHEDLAVTGLAGAGDSLNRFDNSFDTVIENHRLDLYLGQKVDDVLGASIELGVALLAPESLDLGDGDAGHPGAGQCFADLIKFEGPHDGGNQFHGHSRWMTWTGRQRVGR